MIIGIQDEILRLHSLGLLEILLKDKTSKSNILWATDAYQELGSDYQRDKEIRADLITGKQSGVIKNRARKALEQQTERTRQHAEVFTPLWICKRMNEDADNDWFPKKNPRPFDYSQNIRFLKKKKWWNYIDARRLEITCGEAPYLVSRYDVSTGESIPIESRIGLLDHKLRVVNENTSDEEEWLKWTVRAFQSIYGYEFQGDNVLIARVNLLMTFEEYLQNRWKRKPTYEEYRKIANIIVWNIWQMDGLTGTIPYCKAPEEIYQMSVFDYFPNQLQIMEHREKSQPHCRIYDWRRDNSLEFLKINERSERKMKFDFVIGNPPYQDEKRSDSPRDLPIYDKFMDEAYRISDRVLLITPARFLFNAGFTSKAWNKKMLNDKHLTVLYFEANSSKVFPNTQIPGGVAITYRDSNTDYGEIGEFIPYNELRSIIRKCKSHQVMTDLISSRDLFHYSSVLFEEYPEKRKANNNNDVVNSNAFDKFEDIFTVSPTHEDDICFLGRYQNKRTDRFIQRKYIKDNPYIAQNKVVFAQTNGGAGTITDEKKAFVMGTPTVSYSSSGFTDSFICIGLGKDRNAAENCAKYLKTRFTRTLLATLKRTGSITKDKWANVPVQNFTSASDIDWSKSIPEIDQQLYAKYGLDEKEIAFIESHVKEMS